MRITLTFLIFNFAAGLFSADETAIELKVMSFNVRWDGLDKGKNAWINRRPVAVAMIENNTPDVIGLQEPSPTQTLDLDNGLNDYSSFQADHERDQHITFLYRKDRFEKQDGGSFWLVENSNLSGGTRRCVWIKLTEKEGGQSFYVFNNHFDHRSPESRQQSAQRLIEGINRLTKKDPFVVLGDMNEREQGKAISYLLGETGQLVDSYRNFQPEAIGVGTGHGFTGKKNGNRIDYIFVSRQDEVLEAKIIYDHLNGLYPSDHFPVTALVRLYF